MIRPDARAQILRFREAILGGIIAGLGLWWALGSLGLIKWMGIALALLGAAVAWQGLMRARIRVGTGGVGVVQIDDIFIAANSSEEIVIDVTLSASLASGSTIDNSALLSNIAFDDVTVSAQTLYTAQPIQSASGNKLLYLNSVRTVNRTSQIMRRNRPTSQDYRNIGRNNKDGIWTLNPEFQSTFEFSSNTINLNLCLQSNQNNNIQHRVYNCCLSIPHFRSLQTKIGYYPGIAFRSADHLAQYRM